jgi:hypothetical protein
MMPRGPIREVLLATECPSAFGMHAMCIQRVICDEAMRSLISFDSLPNESCFKFVTYSTPGTLMENTSTRIGHNEIVIAG